ncbi:asparagine synthase-related protein [Sphingobium yanoikuyae]|uniref:asparagine synthase-related protein n=1 Tax=Sphingobium yanoikuyae TaxID=13690 RepID=UPI0013CECDF2|nr:asparagine synthase-related protein [Sphingobium yanoikuyae]
MAHILRCSTWQAASPHFDHIATIRRFRQNWRRIVHHAHPPRTSPNFTTALVAPDLVRRTDIGLRRAATMPSRSAYQTEQQRHLSTLTSPQQPYAFEVLDRSAAAAGVRLCFPFYDRRLVEFCVSLPAHAKLDNGYPRASLRNAMAGLLPEQVRLRRDKFNFAGQLGTGMARHRASLLTMLDAQADMLAPFVDIDVARAAITQFDQSMANDAAPLFAAYRIASLGRWLARRSRPVAPRAKFHIVHAGG